jgi:hypothetical protein
MQERRIPDEIYAGHSMIPLGDVRRDEIETALAEAMSLKEQNRLAARFEDQMARHAGSERPPYITRSVRLRSKR